MQKRKNRWYIAVVAVVILAVVLVLAVVLGKKGKNKKDPKMIEPTQQEQASEIPTETEEVFDYSATETAKKELKIKAERCNNNWYWNLRA